MKPLAALAAAVLALGLVAASAPARADWDRGGRYSFYYFGLPYSYGYGYGYGHGYRHRHHHFRRHYRPPYYGYGYYAEPSYRYKRFLRRRFRHDYGNAPYPPRRLSTAAIAYRVEHRHGVRVSAIRFHAGAYEVWGRDEYGQSVKLVLSPRGRLLAFYYLS